MGGRFRQFVLVGLLASAGACAAAHGATPADVRAGAALTAALPPPGVVPAPAEAAPRSGPGYPGAVKGAFRPRSMAYVLQADRLARTQAQAVAMLAACDRDLVVIDYAFDGGHESRWTPDHLRTIRAGRPGRKVVAYLSIGEAEAYRFYWQKAWDADRDGRPDAGAPAFLCPVNPDWEGNYRVRYWQDDWQTIILRYVDAILQQGFDGLYLDGVDTFEFFEEKRGKWIDNRPNGETGNTYRQDMVRWVLRIAAHACAKRTDALIIPQNGAQLLVFPEYLEAVDAVAVEDLFTNGNRTQPPRETRYLVDFLDKAKGAGKPVLVVEYGRSAKAREAAVRGARANGFSLLVTNRNLTGLGESLVP